MEQEKQVDDMNPADVQAAQTPQEPSATSPEPTPAEQPQPAAPVPTPDPTPQPDQAQVSEPAVQVTQVEETKTTDQMSESGTSEVEAALQRDTQDGRGEGEPPESDFQGFATENVEKTGDNS